LDTTSVDFGIENENYFDLTNTWEDPMAAGGDSPNSSDPNEWMESMDDDAPPKKSKKTDPLGANALDEGVENAADTIDQGFEDMMDGPAAGNGDAPATTTDTTAPTEAASSTDSILPPVTETDDEPAAPTATTAPTEAASSIDDMLSDAAPESEDGDSPLGDIGELPWPSKTALLAVHSKQVPSQLAGTITVQKALRTSIEAAVKNTLCAPLAGPGPGPAPAQAPAPALPRGPPSGMLPPPVNVALASIRGHAAKLPAAVFVPAPPLPAAKPTQGGVPAPVPAPAPTPGPMGCVVPKVHVALLPGGKMRKKHVNHMINKPPPNAPMPRGVMVRVTLFDRPNNGVNDMQLAKGKLKQALATGQLKTNIKAAVQAVTGVKPKIAGLKVKSSVVKGWDIPKCEGHMSKLVKQLTVTYTRRQVPFALYNECTNFMTKISFSHDYVLDRRDAASCRAATRSFALRWKLGKKDDPKDFGKMCVKFCEAKYGQDAPLCHIAGGDMLTTQPM